MGFEHNLAELRFMTHCSLSQIHVGTYLRCAQALLSDHAHNLQLKLASKILRLFVIFFQKMNVPPISVSGSTRPLHVYARLTDRLNELL